MSLNLLKGVQIASPCSADWSQMAGDDRVRFCGSCKLNVYNIASMTADEAAGLIESREGRLCLRLYKRHDGTVITRDCPVGIRALRRKVVGSTCRIAAAAALLLTGGLSVATAARESRLPRLRFLQPFTTIRQWLSPIAQKPAPPILVAGDMCIPPPPPAPGKPGGTP